MSLITLPAFLRRREDSPVPETTTAPAAPAPAAEAPLMRFLTQGGAVVELRSHRFRTRYTAQGRPFVSDKYREVNGFTWKCLGCDRRGSGGRGPFSEGEPYLPGEDGQARDDANKHAAACRAMPKPQS
ncbi:hypothetical protein [Streptomyces sp. NPDC001205]